MVGEPIVSFTKDLKDGDYQSTIAFKLAREMKVSPQELAKKIVATTTPIPIFYKAEAKNGFINYWLSKEEIGNTLASINEGRWV